MGRPPIPSNVLRLRGTDRPCRVSPHEPRPTIGAPPCPRHLCEIARAEWRRVAGELVRIGVLARVNGGVLEAYCLAYASMRRAEATLQAAGSETYESVGAHGTMLRAHPAVGVRNAAISRLVSTAAELGLTPASLRRVTASPSASDTEDAEILD